jgi:predicted nucleotidyltransferase
MRESVKMDRSEELREMSKKIAQMLKEKYKVKRIFLIGSLVKGYVHEKSDIDLVVEGLSPKAYIKALVDASDIVQWKVEVNLIPFEDAFETLKEKTLREGELIYGFELKWERFNELCTKLENIIKDLNAEIEKFLEKNGN